MAFCFDLKSQYNVFSQIKNQFVKVLTIASVLIFSGSGDSIAVISAEEHDRTVQCCGHVHSRVTVAL